jgi:hypothetical protein
MAEVILHRMAQRYNLARLRVGAHPRGMPFKRVLDHQDVFPKKVKTACRKSAVWALHITDKLLRRRL